MCAELVSKSSESVLNLNYRLTGPHFLSDFNLPASHMENTCFHYASMLSCYKSPAYYGFNDFPANRRLNIYSHIKPGW